MIQAVNTGNERKAINNKDRNKLYCNLQGIVYNSIKEEYEILKRII